MKLNKINIVLFLVVLILLSGCATIEPVKTNPVVEAPKEKIILAWGEKHQDWTDNLMKEIENTNLKNTKPFSDVICKEIAQENYSEFWAQLISLIAKRESGFKPTTSYEESFKGQDGKKIVSRGLLQISYSSSNQPAYSCKTKNPEQLHDPLHNLSCGVKIISYFLKDNSVMGTEKNVGCGRYWSVCRPIKKEKKSESYKYIKENLENLKICTKTKA